MKDPRNPTEDEIKRVIAFTQTFTREEWSAYVTKIHEEEDEKRQKRIEDVDRAHLKRMILLFAILALILGVGALLKYGQ